MAGKLLNLGFGNAVVARRVLAIVNPGSSPMKRLREEAREAGRLIDCTQGRRTRSIIVTDTGQVILSAVQPETMGQRYEATTFEEQSITVGAEEERS